MPIWKKWIKVNKKASGLLADILLTVIYIVIIIPIAFLLQIFFKKSLLGHAHKSKKNSFWSKKDKITHDLAWAREQ